MFDMALTSLLNGRMITYIYARIIVIWDPDSEKLSLQSWVELFVYMYCIPLGYLKILNVASDYRNELS